jgi:hypothetical protein
VGALPQALEIILVVQMKMSNEKVARKKISFSIHKTPSFFSSLWTPPTFKASHFSFLVHFKQFKVL